MVSQFDHDGQGDRHLFLSASIEVRHQLDAEYRGSIGISIAQTLLTRRTDVHQNEIINSVPITSRQFQNSLSVTQQALTGHYGPSNTLLPAQTSLYQQLAKQAANWAFVDVFRWLSLLCMFCVVVVWFFKKINPGKAPAGAP